MYNGVIYHHPRGKSRYIPVIDVHTINMQGWLTATPSSITWQIGEFGSFLSLSIPNVS